MTIAEIANEMKKFVGGSSFITRKKFAEFMGKKDPHSVDKYLYGLEKADGIDYFILDVAKSVKKRSYI